MSDIPSGQRRFRCFFGASASGATSPPLNNNVIVHHNVSQRKSSCQFGWHPPTLLATSTLTLMTGNIIVWLNQWDCSEQPWRHKCSILKRCFTVPLLIDHCTSAFLETEGLYPSAVHANSREIHPLNHLFSTFTPVLSGQSVIQSLHPYSFFQRQLIQWDLCLTPSDWKCVFTQTSCLIWC